MALAKTRIEKLVQSSGTGTWVPLKGPREVKKGDYVRITDEQGKVREEGEVQDKWTEDEEVCLSVVSGLREETNHD